MSTSSVEVKYYSTTRPINKLELDMLRYNLPSDFTVECKSLDYRCEKEVYIVEIDYTNKRIIIGYKTKETKEIL